MVTPNHQQSALMVPELKTDGTGSYTIPFEGWVMEWDWPNVYLVTPIGHNVS